MKTNSANWPVSIIIPTYNGLELLKKNLPKVIRAVGEAEIIVVDDASSDGTKIDLGKLFPQIKLITLKRNSRFAAAVNRGVKESSGQIVVLLNNDVVPKINFLEPLLKPFKDDWVFAVGCQEKEGDNQDTESIQGRATGSWKRGLLLHQKGEVTQGGSTLWVFGGSGAFRKSMWQQIGGMDELMSPAYEEDRDLGYRAWKRGWKLLYEPKSVVYHRHESTNKQFLGRRMMEISSYQNQFLIVWKNITETKKIIQHLLWLPYHLSVTNYRSGGRLGEGFRQAMRKLPQILAKRKIEVTETVMSDDQILQQFAS